MARGRSVALNFAPGQSVHEFTLEREGDDPSTRADIGIFADDLVLKGRFLSVRVHSLGAQGAPAGNVLLEDDAGRTVASARFPALAAPLDLLPKTADVELALPVAADLARLRVRLILDGTPAEVTDANNVASFARPTLETDRVRESRPAPGGLQAQEAPAVRAQ